MELWAIILLVMVGALAVLGILGFTGIVRPWRDGGDVVTDFLKKENQELAKKVEQLEAVIQKQGEEIKRLSERVVLLRAQYLMLENSHINHPYPTWNCDIDGHLMSANPAFEDYFLVSNDKTLSESAGKAIQEIFDEQGYSEYISKHRLVLSSKRPWEGVITVLIGDKQKVIDVVLYPQITGKQVIGVFGMVIPMERVQSYVSNS